MAANNPTGTRKDPLPVFCFKVDLNLTGGATGEAFFKSVSGLKFETEVVPVRAGGTNDTTFQLVGATKWSNIILKQGFTGSSALLNLQQQWISGQRVRIPTGKIYQLNAALDVVGTWTFHRGWPCKWDLGELDASKNELAIESIEIAHEGLTFVAGKG